MTEISKDAPKGEDGKSLYYDGSGNCQLFHERFDECMKAKGFGGIVDVDDYEVPMRPDDAFQRIANEVGNHGDFQITGSFTTAQSKHLNRCGVVHSSYKACLSLAVKSRMQTANRAQFLNATKANYHALKARVILTYGNWDDTKDKENLVQTMIIPNIKNVSTADKAFARLDELTQERIAWNMPAVNFTAEFFRVWLKDRIKEWSRLASIHSAMELNNNVTFDQGKTMVMIVVDNERRAQAIKMTTADHINAISRSGVMLTGDPAPTVLAPTDMTSFQYGANQAHYDAFQQGYAAAAAAAGPPRDVSTVQCYNCHEFGHYRGACPRPKQGQHHSQPRYQQSGQPQGNINQRFEKFQQFKQQGPRPSALGKRPQSEYGTPNKRVAFKERYPMVGPGPTRLQGSAGVAQAVSASAEFAEYQQFKEEYQEFEEYQAYVAHSFQVEPTDNEYAEAPYRAPGYGEDQA